METTLESLRIDPPIHKLPAWMDPQQVIQVTPLDEESDDTVYNLTFVKDKPLPTIDYLRQVYDSLTTKVFQDQEPSKEACEGYELDRVRLYIHCEPYEVPSYVPKNDCMKRLMDFAQSYPSESSSSSSSSASSVTAFTATERKRLLDEVTPEQARYLLDMTPSARFKALESIAHRPGVYPGFEMVDLYANEEEEEEEDNEEDRTDDTKDVEEKKEDAM
jgi:hypothetical protein